jgi:hypothetical protein
MRYLPRRRDFLAFTAGAAAAKAALPLPAKADSEPDVQALWQRYLGAFREAKKASRAGEELRDALVAQYGDPWGRNRARALWGRDPRYPILVALNEESNRIEIGRVDRLDEMMRCPSQRIADLRVKLAAVLGEWRQNGEIVSEECEYHLTLAFLLMQDAETVLGPVEVA